MHIGSMNIDEIIAHQGWNDNSVKELLFRYIEQQGSMDALRDFLAQAAEEENCEVKSEEDADRLEWDALATSRPIEELEREVELATSARLK